MILLDDWCQRSLITISGFFIPGRDMTALFYSPAEIKHWKRKGQLSGEKSWRVTSTTTSCQRSCDYSDSWGALLNECSLRLLSRPSLLKILGMNLTGVLTGVLTGDQLGVRALVQPDDVAIHFAYAVLHYDEQ